MSQQPAEVINFINRVRSDSPQTFAQLQAEEAQEDRPLIHGCPHHLFLRLFLLFLRSKEGAEWITTLPLPEQTAFTGVKSSLERVLAVGVIIGTIYRSTA